MMIKRILPWVIFGFLLVLFVVGYSYKDSMNRHISKMMRDQATPELKKEGSNIVDSLYNYSANGLGYQITFLEFGAKGCTACKRMEPVLDEIRNAYTQKVNVVFLNVLLPENQNLMKYYGIATIPTQVLLDKNGKEYFRHSGYYSFEDLVREIEVSDK